MLCDDCGLRYGQPCIDPYSLEIENEHVERILCRTCYKARRDDV